MKSIAIDIREAVTEKPAGKGIYTLNITKELVKYKKIRWVLLSDVPTKIFKDVIVIKGNGLRWHLEAASYLKKNKIDHFLAPTSFITPIFLGSIPFSIVVHDLICFLYPKGHNLKARLIERFALPRLLKKATNIFTVSQNTKKDLLTIFPHTDESKVTVTKCGVNLEKFTPQKKKEPVILTVSTLIPRKNIMNLIKAFDAIKDQIPHDLVIIGDKGPSFKSINEYINTNNLNNRVKIRGYVKNLANEYANAEIFVYPSFYEGFGIPIIEALASGTKVACSERSSLPEAGGVYANYFNPDDIESISITIIETLKQKNNVKEKLDWVKNFSWKSVADNLLQKII